jgi:hypothetical protein
MKITKEKVNRVIVYILLFIIGFLIGNKCFAQPGCGVSSFRTCKVYAGLKHYDHAIGITFQGVDAPYLIAGIIYHQKYKNFGFYTSASKGKYWVYGTTYEIPHYKFALGLKYMAINGEKVNVYFVAGGSYHSFWGNNRIDIYDGKVNPDENYYRLHHISCEQGMGADIGRITTGFRIDFIRGEHNIDFALNF